jgi:hypothetical protein
VTYWENDADDVLAELDRIGLYPDEIHDILDGWLCDMFGDDGPRLLHLPLADKVYRLIGAGVSAELLIRDAYGYT